MSGSNAKERSAPTTHYQSTVSFCLRFANPKFALPTFVLISVKHIPFSAIAQSSSTPRRYTPSIYGINHTQSLFFLGILRRLDQISSEAHQQQNDIWEFAASSHPHKSTWKSVERGGGFKFPPTCRITLARHFSPRMAQIYCGRTLPNNSFNPFIPSILKVGSITLTFEGGDGMSTVFNLFDFKFPILLLPFNICRQRTLFPPFRNGIVETGLRIC